MKNSMETYRKDMLPARAQHPRNGDPDNIRVLFYHRIGPERPACESTGVTIARDTFRRHLELLEQWGYSTITFQDYALYCQGALSLPRKPVIITFDDGYRDVFTYAYPVMREFGMRGVVFVLGSRSIRTNEWDRGISPVYELLREEEILELHEAGFEIGAHSMHHVRLTGVAESESWNELYEARIGLEILLNAPVRTLSYPYGLANEAIKQMARDAGYTIACGAFTGPPIFGSDHLEVRRIRMNDSKSRIAFWFQLQSVYVHYRWLWWLMKKALQGTLHAFRRRMHGGARTAQAPEAPEDVHYQMEHRETGT